MNKLLITTIFISMTFVSCVRLDTSLNNLRKPVFYSDIQVKNFKNFEVDHTNYYFYSYTIIKDNNKTVEQLLDEVLEKNPSAKGIKNLKVTIYNKSWLSYGIAPNPLGIVTSTFILLGNLIGFSNKSIYIKGELFY